MKVLAQAVSEQSRLVHGGVVIVVELELVVVVPLLELDVDPDDDIVPVLLDVVLLVVPPVPLDEVLLPLPPPVPPTPRSYV